MFLTTLNSKRNGEIIKRLYQLHLVSCCDGLFQLLDKIDFNLNDIKERRNLNMALFAPTVKYCENILKQVFECTLTSTSTTAETLSDETEACPINITEKATEFCEQYKLDCSSSKVFVNNIDFKVKQRELWDFFEYFGKVLRCSIIKDRKTKRSRGFAFVIFSSPQHANSAINAKNYELRLNGRVMVVKPATRQKKSTKSEENTSLSKAEQKMKDAAQYFLNNDLGEQKCQLEKEICPFKVLCDDMILEIFSYLDLITRIKIELVCKKWQNLAIESWGNVHHVDFHGIFQISHKYAGLTDRVLISLLKKGCQNLISLDLSASPYLLSHYSLIYIGNICEKLESINLSFTSVQNKTLKHLGSKLLQLKKINLARCLHVGEKGLWWLFKDLKHLEYLKLTETTRLSGKCLYMLPPTLKTVDFNTCSKLSDLGLKNLAMRCPNLTNIDISLCLSITDAGVNALLETCTNVFNLSMKGLSPTLVTSRGLLSLRKLNKLISLDISQNSSVDDDVIKTVSRSCSKLKCLNIEACHGDITCEGIKSLCLLDELTDLNISYIVKVCTECLSELALHGKLEKLLVKSCPGISNEGVVTCLIYLDSLHTFDLSGCYTVDDGFIDDNRLKNVLRQHMTLDLILGASEVTEEGLTKLKEIFTWCNPTLQNLRVNVLRNDRDPMYIEYSDEDDDIDEEDREAGEEKEETQPQHNLRPCEFELEFDVNADYSMVDEDGESLYVVEKCSPLKQDKDFLVNDREGYLVEHLQTAFSNLEENFPNTEENWDDETDGSRVWEVAAESLHYSDEIDVDDDYLENDDVSRNELIG